MSLADAVGAELRERGVDAALRLCETRALADPQDADAQRHLGQIRAARGEHGLALRAAMRACELAPEDPRAWSDLGRVHALAGGLDDAAQCFTESIQVDVRHADGWHNLGAALHKLGRHEPALDALRNALRIDAKRGETWLALGELLVEGGQFEDAVRCFENAAKHDPSLARASTRLADRMSIRGKVKHAEALFRQSLALDPDQAEGWLGLARTLEDLGQGSSARAAYLNALRRHPGNALALSGYLALAPDRDAAEGDDGESAAWLRQAEAALLEPAVKDEAKALVGYGLAKYHDRRGDYARAAAAGLAANAARERSAGALDRAELAARVDGLIAACTPEFFRERRRHGSGNDQPVFIVGLPRSGTTLTEQILSAHPRLHGAGELPDLARLATQVCDEAPWRAATLIEAGRSRALAGEYLRALRDGAPRRRLRYSDKSPLNFFQLAFAALLFPNARVIHCRRSARDTALSMWLENFNLEQRYATNFDDLAFFTAQYERLMAHWRAVLPLPMLELQYEDTVQALEPQARRLIGFLGAPWEPGCLDFHRNARPVQTPSRWQVRQPLYASSVGRWRHYAEHLPGLLWAFPEGHALP